MAKSRSFGGISASVWQCVKSTSASEHGTTYDPPNGNSGTSTTSTLVGDVVLTFAFDVSKETVTYGIQKKPFVVSDDQIWNGIQETVDHCQA